MDFYSSVQLDFTINLHKKVTFKAPITQRMGENEKICVGIYSRRQGGWLWEKREEKQLGNAGQKMYTIFTKYGILP